MTTSTGIDWTLTPDGADFIAAWEGFVALPYRCPAGYPTIGYGHVIQPGERWAEPGARIGQAEALDLLMQDAARTAAPVARALAGATLKPFEVDALSSLAFNMGGFAIARSTLVRLLQQGVRDVDQFLRWVYVREGAKMVRSRGLERRREAERKMFLFADYSGRP